MLAATSWGVDGGAWLCGCVERLDVACERGGGVWIFRDEEALETVYTWGKGIRGALRGCVAMAVEARVHV